MLRYASKIASDAHKAAMKHIKPGMYEYQLERYFDVQFCSLAIRFRQGILGYRGLTILQKMLTKLYDEMMIVVCSVTLLTTTEAVDIYRTLASLRGIRSHSFLPYVCHLADATQQSFTTDTQMHRTTVRSRRETCVCLIWDPSIIATVRSLWVHLQIVFLRSLRRHDVLPG